MIIRDSLLRDMAKLVAWYPLRWFVTLNPWCMAYFLGNTVGRLDSVISGGRVARIMANLRHAFGDSRPDDELRTIATAVVRRHYVEHMEFYKFASLRPSNLSKRIRFEGKEYLDRALAEGHGAVLVHMHYGCKQFPLVALGLMGYEVAQLGYRDPTAEDHSFIHRNVHLRIRMKLEDRFRVRHVHVGNSLRPAYDVVRKNGVLMITGDGIGGIRGAGPNYLPVTFLGQTMLFPPGPARIAAKTGAALLPLFCVQNPDNTYRAVIEEPISLQSTGDREADTLENTCRFAARFAEYVTRYPDHWMFWEEFTPGNLLAAT